MLLLEYICTDAEMREAQSLNTRQQLGKGSRVRTHLVLFGMLAFVLGLAYLQMRTEIAPRYRPWFLALIALVFVFFVLKRKLARKCPKKPAKLELSDREVTIVNDGTRVSTQWSGFGECIESPNLFVLVDKTKRYLLVFPKHVFPDESAQNWFRNQASQRPNVAASSADLPVVHSAPPVPDGIVLNFQLGYKDYLNRMLISWKTKGILLMMYLFIFGLYLHSLAHPVPNAVNSPTKVLLVFMLPMTTIGMAIVLPVATFFTWRSHKKYLPPRQFVLSAGRIGMAEPDGTAFAPWTAYKYWLENQWCFMIWKGQHWDMFPKRAFASQAEIEKCRAFLQQNLKLSRWFFL
jgi:FtsH-binding integral membrane protein